MKKPNHLYWFLVTSGLLGLGACTSSTSLWCWEQRGLAPHSPDERGLIALGAAENTAQLDQVAAKFSADTNSYLLYRYHLKRSSLETNPVLRTAFKEYANELEARQPQGFFCHE